MSLPVALTSTLPLGEHFTAEYLVATGVLPVRRTAEAIEVAVVDAPEPEVLEDLRAFYGAPLILLPVAREVLEAAIRQAWAAAESVAGLVRRLDDGAPDVDDRTLAGDETADLRSLADEPPVVQYVHLLVREAAAAGASDIHLEATREGLRARLRLDGVLNEVASPPKGLQHAVVSRVKLAAQLDIAERRAPQDGRMRVRLETRDLDLRVATMPTLHGESVVLRLLDRGGRPVTLTELGMSPAVEAAWERLARRPNGILLATGPTGSGKTTTLYAALGLRDPAAEKIVTVEDPVEYHLPGVTQVPVQPKAGVTFAAALRSLLRQDPDVLMIGELRDGETAAIAVQAALTGHLVFATLHTNDAAAALPRLRDLGVEAYLVAGTVEGVLAQRLVRRICPACREVAHPDPALLALAQGTPAAVPGVTPLHQARAPVPTLYRGAGCAQCRGTGFRGRTAIAELLVLSEPLRQAVLAGASLSALRAEARATGLVPLRADGWQKALAGITTVEEVLRVAAE